MDWRKRLDELEKQVQQATDRGEFVGVRDRLAWDITMDHVPKLIEGYRLLAEAVEACAHLEKVREEADWDGLNIPPDVLEAEEGLQKMLDAALAHMRGVGNA